MQRLILTSTEFSPSRRSTSTASSSGSALRCTCLSNTSCPFNQIVSPSPLPTYKRASPPWVAGNVVVPNVVAPLFSLPNAFSKSTYPSVRTQSSSTARHITCRPPAPTYSRVGSVGSSPANFAATPPSNGPSTYQRIGGLMNCSARSTAQTPNPAPAAGGLPVSCIRPGTRAAYLGRQIHPPRLQGLRCEARSWSSHRNQTAPCQRN